MSFRGEREFRNCCSLCPSFCYHVHYEDEHTTMAKVRPIVEVCYAVDCYYHKNTLYIYKFSETKRLRKLVN